MSKVFLSNQLLQSIFGLNISPQKHIWWFFCVWSTQTEARTCINWTDQQQNKSIIKNYSRSLSLSCQRTVKRCRRNNQFGSVAVESFYEVECFIIKSKLDLETLADTLNETKQIKTYWAQPSVFTSTVGHEKKVTSVTSSGLKMGKFKFVVSICAKSLDGKRHKGKG